MEAWITISHHHCLIIPSWETRTPYKTNFTTRLSWLPTPLCAFCCDEPVTEAPSIVSLASSTFNVNLCVAVAQARLMSNWKRFPRKHAQITLLENNLKRRVVFIPILETNWYWLRLGWGRRKSLSRRQGWNVHKSETKINVTDMKDRELSMGGKRTTLQVRRWKKSHRKNNRSQPTQPFGKSWRREKPLVYSVEWVDQGMQRQLMTGKLCTLRRWNQMHSIP